MKKLYPGLRAEMVRHGETQKELAKLLGITRENVCLRLNGHRDFSISEIEKICEYYNKDYYELFK